MEVKLMPTSIWSPFGFTSLCPSAVISGSSPIICDILADSASATAINPLSPIMPISCISVPTSAKASTCSDTPLALKKIAPVAAAATRITKPNAATTQSIALMFVIK